MCIGQGCLPNSPMSPTSPHQLQIYQIYLHPERSCFALFPWHPSLQLVGQAGEMNLPLPS